MLFVSLVQAGGAGFEGPNFSQFSASWGNPMILYDKLRTGGAQPLTVEIVTQN